MAPCSRTFGVPSVKKSGRASRITNTNRERGNIPLCPMMVQVEQQNALSHYSETSTSDAGQCVCVFAPNRHLHTLKTMSDCFEAIDLGGTSGRYPCLMSQVAPFPLHATGLAMANLPKSATRCHVRVEGDTCSQQKP